jgi:predicted ABC-type ATPase
MPKVVIIAGPNGAGKTTFARNFLPNEAATVQFVNADLIAAGISPFDPASAAFAAGRVMLRRLSELVHERKDFALETTLSGNWLRDQILEWRTYGYEIELYYLRLSSVEISLERIRTRVLRGGHNIPENVARRRFQRSRTLFETVYKGLVDEWFLYDNDGDEPLPVSSSVEK